MVGRLTTQACPGSLQTDFQEFCQIEYLGLKKPIFAQKKSITVVGRSTTSTFLGVTYNYKLKYNSNIYGSKKIEVVIKFLQM